MLGRLHLEQHHWSAMRSRMRRRAVHARYTQACEDCKPQRGDCVLLEQSLRLEIPTARGVVRGGGSEPARIKRLRDWHGKR